MSLFRELRRRNVFRVGIAYAVTGWLLVEVGDYAGETFGAPDWVMQMFTVLLMLGFPIALIIAWAFEVTPEGIMRTPVRQGSSPERASDRKSVAVLPFANVSTEKENEYFADGLSEELLNVLAHIDGLRVAGRTSCFAFKGENRDLREIGQKLDVNHILEGSVRKSGNRLRITAQLVGAADGYHLWSETYDRELDDIFAIQDDIASAVAEILRVKIFGDTERESPRIQDGAVYALYLEARFHQRRMKFDELQKAEALYRQVLAESPNFVPALAACAEAWAHMVAAGDIPYEQGWPEAQRLIKRALAVDPDHAEAQMVQGLFRGWWERHMAEGERHLRRAIELNPNYADAYRRLGAHLRLQRRFDETLPLFNKALSLDPLAAINLRQLSYTHYCMGNDEKAESLLIKALELDPHSGGLHANLSEIYRRQGDFARAWEEIEKEPVEWSRMLGETLLAIDEGKNGQQLADRFEQRFGEIASYQMGIIYCRLGEKQRSLDWLEKAERARDPGVMQILMDPLLEPLRDEPRFQELARTLNLLQ